MERGTVVESLRQIDEIFHMIGRHVRKKAQDDLPPGSFFDVTVIVACCEPVCADISYPFLTS